MAKLWTYLTIMIGITALLTLAGIDTGLGWFLNIVGMGSGSASFSTSSLLIAIGLVLASAGVVGAGGIFLGFFTMIPFEYVFLAPFATGTLIAFIGVFTAVINYANGFPGWIYYPIWIIFGVLAIGYAMAAIEWVFNRGGT